MPARTGEGLVVLGELELKRFLIALFSPSEDLRCGCRGDRRGEFWKALCGDALGGIRGDLRVPEAGVGNLDAELEATFPGFAPCGAEIFAGFGNDAGSVARDRCCLRDFLGESRSF